MPGLGAIECRRAQHPAVIIKTRQLHGCRRRFPCDLLARFGRSHWHNVLGDEACSRVIFIEQVVIWHILALPLGFFIPRRRVILRAAALPPLRVFFCTSVLRCGFCTGLRFFP